MSVRREEDESAEKHEFKVVSCYPGDLLKQLYFERQAAEAYKRSLSTINKPNIMSTAIEFVQKQALKLANPDEYALREAGLHDNCGKLTTEGKELRDSFLEKLVLPQMVEVAKQMEADKTKGN